MPRELFDPYENYELQPAHRPHWEAKRRVADAIRELSNTLYTSAPDEAELVQIAEQLEAAASNFKQQPRLYGRLEYCGRERFGEYGEVFHETSPLSGRSNPLAPPLHMWLDKDQQQAIGKTELGWSYEGPPGHVHGGFVAAVFDDFMGMAQHLAENAGMTGTLTIRYRRPTPLNTPLELRAWVVSSEGRKTIVHASMHAGEQLTAECEALFIRPKQSLGFER